MGILAIAPAMNQQDQGDQDRFEEDIKREEIHRKKDPHEHRDRHEQEPDVGFGPDTNLAAGQPNREEADDAREQNHQCGDTVGPERQLPIDGLTSDRHRQDKPQRFGDEADFGRDGRLCSTGVLGQRRRSLVDLEAKADAQQQRQARGEDSKRNHRFGSRPGEKDHQGTCQGDEDQ